MAATPIRVGILVYDEVEVLDACGPFEVFSVASRLARRRRSDSAAPFEVITISAEPTTTIRARGGLTLVADRLLIDSPACDVVLVPGGVSDRIESDERVLGWIRRSSRTALVIASVCTGAFPLARAGILDGLTVTTHAEDLAELQARYPAVRVVPDTRYLDHGHVATSAGVSAGIDLALSLVARLAEEELARATARQMEYSWRPSSTPPRQGIP